MNLVSMDGVALALKDGYLFENLSLGIEEGEGLGLVGRNGAGKTSLLRLISGKLEPDRGVIARRRGLEISVLEQMPLAPLCTSVADFLYHGQASEIERARRLRDLELRSAPERELDAARKALSAAGPVSLENRYRSFLGELGLTDLERCVDTLSGGQLKKAAIARTLAAKADLVILDEPTNHLDMETIEWLEARLLSASFAFLLVTHDRWFLDTVSDSILEIDRREVFRHPGNYSAYLERKAERYAAMEKAENRRTANLKIELAWLNRGARARATKSERRKDEIKAMQAQALVREARPSSFSSVESRLGKKVLEFLGASKSYDAIEVLKSFSFELLPGARVGIVGPNGSGKTTLLDLAAGRLEPSAGLLRRGETVRLAYFEQTALALNPALTVLDFVREHAERIRLADGSSLTAEQLLERFRFPRDFQGLTLGRLSGGEIRRLQLVRLLAEAPNVLLMDEPTNDLDIETIELLEDYLEGFPGCLLVVSHDRAFLDRTCETILVLDGEGGLLSFPGRYGEWLENRKSGRGQAGAEREAKGRSGAAERGSAAGREEAAPPGPAYDASPVKKRLSYAEKKELDSLLGFLEELEAEKTSLEALFASSSPDPAALERGSRRHAELLGLIEAKTLRWEELAAREASL